MLQISANVVKSRLHRARAALKRMVEKEFEALGVEVDGVHDFECTWQYLSASAKDPVPAAVGFLFSGSLHDRTPRRKSFL